MYISTPPTSLSYLFAGCNMRLFKNEKDKPQGGLVIMMTTHPDLQLMFEDVPTKKKLQIIQHSKLERHTM